VGWGSYLGGAIDARGRALLVYWANGRSDPNKTGFEAMTGGYRRSTIGYTLVDTVKGTSVNGIIDAPGAPYCYSHVVFDRRGAHVFTVRAEVKEWLLCRSRNHYTDLRYYYTPDPASGEKWRRVTIYQDARASIQPLGMEVDPAGRVHLLYYYVREEEDGRVTPHRLVYAVSRQPVRRERMPNVRIWPHQTALHGEPGHPSPEFVQHTLKSDGWDGRLFQTRSGRIGVLAYRAGLAAEWTEVKDGIAGKFTPWVACDLTVPQCRIFPISRRSGAALTEEIEGVFLGVPNRPERHSMFHFRLPLPAAQTVRR
jgi:hypothetical protein